jgi:glycosyltransferase involved in cell wall biosynthesis
VKQSVAYQLFLAKHQLKPEHKIILYVGSEHPRKNLGVLLEAFARVARHDPNVRLLKVGEPGVAAGRAAFLTACDRLSVRSRVRLLGTLNDDDLRLVYSMADVFVFPSTFEGFGLPPLEAMACGCPTVISRATSLPEVVGDAAVLCDPSDAAAVTHGINSILDNPARARELRERGLKHAAQFTWENVAQKTLAVYQRVLKESAQGAQAQ